MELDHNKPLFDSAYDALVFALNQTGVMPRPFMNKAMADAPTKKRRKKGEPEPTRRTPARAPVPLRGLDAIGQAGFILQQLERLDPPHKLVLTGLLTKPRTPCQCASPCCQGWRPVTRYQEAIRLMVVVLVGLSGQSKLDVSGTGPGLSQQIGLWFFLVDAFFTKADLPRLASAKAQGVSVATLVKHATWVHEVLGGFEGKAWQDIDLLFDQTGVTGPLD